MIACDVSPVAMFFIRNNFWRLCRESDLRFFGIYVAEKFMCYVQKVFARKGLLTGNFRLFRGFGGGVNSALENFIADFL